jgi:hypothetical protein
MKMNLILTLLLATCALRAQTIPTTSFTNTTMTVIPDGNPVGAVEQFTVGGVSGEVAN